MTDKNGVDPATITEPAPPTADELRAAIGEPDERHLVGQVFSIGEEGAPVAYLAVAYEGHWWLARLERAK